MKKFDLFRLAGHRGLHRIVVVMAMLSLLAFGAMAQDAATDDTTMAKYLTCHIGAGCAIKDSILTIEETNLMLGEPDSGGFGTVYCDDISGCVWTQLSPQEAHKIAEGEGVIPAGELVRDGDRFVRITSKPDPENEDGYVFKVEAAYDPERRENRLRR